MAYGLGYMIMVIVSCVMLFNKKVQRGLLCLFISTILILEVTVLNFVPKVEKFSQGAAIEYFESFIGKDVYVYPLSYHSYAHLYYTRKQPGNHPAGYNDKDRKWLLEGPVDKPTYFICRIQDSEPWRAHPNLEVTGEKNGFVFFKRK